VNGRGLGFKVGCRVCRARVCVQGEGGGVGWGGGRNACDHRQIWRRGIALAGRQRTMRESRG
jgi:hypothetical protein